MYQEKSWMESTTIWGAIVAVVASLLSAFGVTIHIGAENELPDAVLQLIGAIGGLVAIYGRLAATDLIS